MGEGATGFIGPFELVDMKLPDGAGEVEGFGDLIGKFEKLKD
jgi:hypothetical protein